jgi:hypothetical protein
MAPADDVGIGLGGGGKFQSPQAFRPLLAPDRDTGAKSS